MIGGCLLRCSDTVQCGGVYGQDDPTWWWVWRIHNNLWRARRYWAKASSWINDIFSPICCQPNWCVLYWRCSSGPAAACSPWIQLLRQRSDILHFIIAVCLNAKLPEWMSITDPWFSNSFRVINYKQLCSVNSLSSSRSRRGPLHRCSTMTTSDGMPLEFHWWSVRVSLNLI